jgi:Phage integrase family
MTTALDAQNIVNRYFKPLLRRAGLPDIRWHDLSHTCATLLLGRGVHPKMVQHLMGHASIQLTLDRYFSLDTLDGSCDHRRCGRGLGIKSTAAKPPVERAGYSTFLRYLQVKRRVDERTRTAFLLQIRVCLSTS